MKNVKVINEIWGKDKAVGLKKVNVAFGGQKLMRHVNWHEDYGKFGKARPFVVIKKKRYGLME